MKPKAKRTIRPSGVEQTDSMFYWKCTVSGLVMFATPERFADVVKKFGSEEKLVKTYVLRPVKKYLEAGYTAEQIKAVIEKNGGKLPALDASEKVAAPFVSTIEKKEKKQTVEVVAAVEIKPIEQPKEKEPVFYEWQGNPDYFKGASSPISISEDTKIACFYPNRNLDDQCRGCSIYADCNSSAKYSPEDQKKPKRNEVKIKAIVVTDSP
jgi:hypothetical protein